MNINFSDKKVECISETEYQQLHSKKTYCPKCHPYIAGCIVVLIFLFTVYHRKQIESFFTSILLNNSATNNGYQMHNISTATNNSITSAEPSTNLSHINATNQHFLANCSIQQTTGLCNFLITIAISLILLLI